MTTERIPTIWDQPLPRADRPQPRARSAERFLTIWSRPVARLAERGRKTPA
ncbi:hypothetical protein [Halomonas sp. BM-2019]|uniref:hypothetical protein n=1 Tax=Halomonas sp. BM-2019 TaxID=2811227 RepID=UPI001B3C3DC6|nr:MAG: hypothetical protein J5F18_12635 [Halomonas sp. BM-2019]